MFSKEFSIGVRTKACSLIAKQHAGLVKPRMFKGYWVLEVYSGYKLLSSDNKATWELMTTETYKELTR